MSDEIEPAGDQTDYAKQQKAVKHQTRVEIMKKTNSDQIARQVKGPEKKGK